MAATQLGIYNRALVMLGERRLSSLLENRDSQRALTAVWDADFIDFVLSRGQWNFAARSIELSYSPSVTPAFGYQYAFDKPDDFIRTMKFCSDERMQGAEINYQDHPHYWFADLETVYVQYVSNDPLFGRDLSGWPATFAEYAATVLAERAAPRINTDKDRLVIIKKDVKDRLTVARSQDAMESPSQIVQHRGTWRASRGGGRTRY